MKSERVFQFWEYIVNHGQLLIRSPINDSNDQNIDLIFMGVEYVNLPRYLRGIAVVEPTEDEILNIKHVVKHRLEQNKIYIIESEGIRFSIVASSLTISENKMDIFESHFDI